MAWPSSSAAPAVLPPPPGRSIRRCEARLGAPAERAPAALVVPAAEQACQPRLQAEEAVHQEAERDRGATFLLLAFSDGLRLVRFVLLRLLVRPVEIVGGAVQTEPACDRKRIEPSTAVVARSPHKRSCERAAHQPGRAAQHGVTHHSAETDRQRPGRGPWQACCECGDECDGEDPDHQPDALARERRWLVSRQPQSAIGVSARAQRGRRSASTGLRQSSPRRREGCGLAMWWRG